MDTTIEKPRVEQEEVHFRSKGVNFRAVIKPSRRKTTEFGMETIPGTAADFAPTGDYRTSDPEVVEYLRALPTFNVEFWEVGHEPGQAPSIEPVIDRIAAAIIELDDAALSQLDGEERSSFNRPEVLAMISSARRRVQGALSASETVADELIGGTPAPPAVVTSGSDAEPPADTGGLAAWAAGAGQ